MKKIVNGKLIDIKNVELFEAAFEGLALGRLVSSSISDTISENTHEINSYIAAYESIYKSLPFPLYSVNLPIFYSAMAMCLREKVDLPNRMWVDNSLYVQVEANKALKFLGSSWGIVSIQKPEEDNTDIENYNGQPGYNEYKWVVIQTMKEESLRNFYAVFMREFIAACNKEPLIIKFELGRMLDFGPVPDKINLKENRLVDTGTQSEYFIDIFSTGKKKTKDSELVFNLSKGGELRRQYKQVNTYDFDIYEKKAVPEDIMEGAQISKMQQCDLDGAAAVFETIYARGASLGGVDKVSYTGIVIGNEIIFGTGGRLYLCTANKYSKPIEIARNADIYSYESGFVYIVKRVRCDSGVTKEMIYSYNLNDAGVRLCKIQFS